MTREQVAQKQFQFYTMKIDLMKRQELFLLENLYENEAFDKKRFDFVFNKKMVLPKIIEKNLKSMKKWVVVMGIRLGFLRNKNFYNESKDKEIPYTGILYRYGIIDKWKAQKLEIQQKKQEILDEMEMRKMLAMFG
ncbi:hypothetical protein HOG47_07670 [archaeon]|nr:hypothetical protein [archaeon]